MRESGEPMECGIFDFYKVFSKAFGEGEDGAAGNWMEDGVLSTILDIASAQIRSFSMMYVNLVFIKFVPIFNP